MAESMPAALVIEPAALPEVWAMLVSSTESCRAPNGARILHRLKPRIAAISEPPIDHPVLSPK